MRPFDPRDWTHERLSFSASRVLGQIMLARRRDPRPQSYAEAILVRRPGRNGFETFPMSGLVAALYASAILALLASAAPGPVASVIFLPLLPFLTLAAALVQIIVGGLVCRLAQWLRIPIPRLRAAGFTHLVLATVTAGFLALAQHWTRWVGIFWLALTALNLLSGLVVLILRPWFRRASQNAWRDTQYVD